MALWVFGLVDRVANSLSILSMTGMTVARLGVSREKNSVASLRI
jgi:hypothetical protein